MLSSISTASGKGNVRACDTAGNPKRGLTKSNDLLGLSWVYGREGEGSDSKKRKRADDASAESGGVTKQKTQMSHGDGNGSCGGKKGALDIEPTPNSEMHPDGLMDGSVPVPKQSRVYKVLADKYNVRPEARNSEATARQVAQAQVLLLPRVVLVSNAIFQACS